MTIRGECTAAPPSCQPVGDGLVLGWTRILSPTVVNEFRFSWSKADSDAVQEPFGQLPPPDAQIGNTPSDPIVAGGLAGITIDGYFGGPGLGRIGSPDFLPKFQRTNQLEFPNTLSAPRTRSPSTRPA